MNVLEHKKRSHIAGYVISMWHIEDIVRAQAFDTEKTLALLIPADAPPEEQHEARQVYGGIIKRMQDQNLQKKGHLLEVTESVTELQYLHDSIILAKTDEDYLKLYEIAKAGISDLQNLGEAKSTSELEACFNGVYGVLLLRAQETKISEGTVLAEAHIRKMLDALSDRFREVRSFPDVSLN